MAKTDELQDDELYDLFSALDDVTASDDLKAATLERVLADEDAATFKATAGTGRKAATRRSRWRVVRVAAVAACLVMALTGGAAYALPASYVTISQGGVTIELGINRFGVAVSAASDDELGREVVESTELRNVSYEEALARACEAIEERSPESPLELAVRSDDEALKNGIEAENEAFLAERGVGEPGGEAAAQPSGQPVEQEAEWAGDQPVAPEGAPEPAGSGSPEGDRGADPSGGAFDGAGGAPDDGSGRNGPAA